jgi:hypothetical protein
MSDRSEMRRLTVKQRIKITRWLAGIFNRGNDASEEQASSLRALREQNLRLEETGKLQKELLRANELLNIIFEDVAVILNASQIPARTAELIQKHFGFDGVEVFLLDEMKRFVVLEGAAGTDSRKRGTSYPLQSDESVCLLLQEGAFPIRYRSSGSGESPGRENLFLLIFRGEKIGVLIIKGVSKFQLPWTEQEVLLQKLSGRIAIAIYNAKQYQLAQKRLEAERRRASMVSGAAWREFIQGKQELSHRYDPGGLLEVADKVHPAATPPNKNHPGVYGEHETHSPTQSSRQSFEIPIIVRNQVIGVLNALKPDQAGEWTDEERGMLHTLTDQLGIALESARLYQDTQRRAAHERLVGDITARMRESLDLDAVLKSAVEEIYQSLALEEVMLTLVEDENP